MTLSAGWRIPASLALLAALSAPWQPAAAGTAGSISGRVTSASTGEPVAGLVVGASGQIPGDGHVRSGQTDSAGVYHLTGLAPDQYTVYFFAYRSAFASERYPDAHGNEAATLVPLADGQDATGIDVALDPGGTIIGTVTSGMDGTGLSGAQACPVDASDYEYTCQGTGTDGTYVLTGLPVGTYRVRFAAPPSSPLVPEYYLGARSLASATEVQVHEGYETALEPVSLDDPAGDVQPPTITMFAIYPASNAVGWWRSLVTAYFTCTDVGSGPVEPSVVGTVSTEGAAQSLRARCEDLAGNVSTETMPNINIDWTPPTIGPETSDPAANPEGWVTSDVTISWACTDALSGPQQTSGSIVVTTEGAAQNATLTCADMADNAATRTHSVSLDRTAPSVTWIDPIEDRSAFLFGQVPPEPTCSATDALSGPDSCIVTGYSTSVGEHRLTATARDRAGNVGTESSTYTVQPWTLVGFRPPVTMSNWNLVKAGASLPLKFEVFAGSHELTSASVVTGITTEPVACASGSGAPVSSDSTTMTGVEYDVRNGYYAYIWKAPRTPGACLRVRAATQDGSTLAASVQVR